MCGIAGAINFNIDYQQVNASMLHRGPDAQNGCKLDNVDLYHLRLSILDINGGQQPMHLHNRYTIVFNGEIYNHQSLRDQFHLHPTTHSDTEILLLLFEQFGADCLSLLDGMFVFAIYDNQTKQLFIARDRAGKKPLYIYQHQGAIVFASELNCLRQLLPLEIETHHLFEYVRLGSFFQQHTPYKNITTLGAGTYATIDCSSLQIDYHKWWDIHSFYKQPSTDSFEEAVEKTEHLLTTAVKRRLESSDVEVGCFLSGGIDSGLVTAIASQHTSKLKTLTVAFEGTYSEAPLAKMVSDRYQTDHTELTISFDHLQQDIEKILCQYGQTFFDSSAIPSYYVSQAAKKQVTVVLNGDGADELFAGYRRYVPFAQHDFFKSSCVVRKTAAVLHSLLPHSHNKKSLYNYIYRLLSFASQSDENLYLSAGVDIMEGHQQQILASGDYMNTIRQSINHTSQASLTGLQKIMQLDFEINLFDDLLVKMDIATMSHSLEGRSPFLGKELLEYAPTLPDHYKIRRQTTKYLLRTLAKKYLPEPLILQPKRGFEVPLKQWVNHELKEVIQDYLSASNAFHKSIINPIFTQQLLRNAIDIPAEKRAKILWMLFSMEVWHKKIYRRQ
jgi:asparagine synthase (glutamine-hydrolysing)